VEGLQEYKGKITHAPSLRGQKVRIVGMEELLSLPCGFIF
jgi:hypothetical protein